MASPSAVRDSPGRGLLDLNQALKFVSQHNFTLLSVRYNTLDMTVSY